MHDLQDSSARLSELPGTGQHHSGALRAHEYREAKKARFDQTEADLVRARVAHGMLMNDLDASRKANKTLEQQLEKMRADNAKLKMAKGREHLLSEEQAKLRVAQHERNVLADQLREQQNVDNDLTARMQEADDFRVAYMPITLVAVNRQIASYSLEHEKSALVKWAHH